MICSFCRREFDEAKIAEACRACPSGGGCHHVRCPFCGNEMPREPRLVKAMKSFFRKLFKETSS